MPAGGVPLAIVLLRPSLGRALKLGLPPLKSVVAYPLGALAAAFYLPSVIVECLGGQAAEDSRTIPCCQGDAATSTKPPCCSQRASRFTGLVGTAAPPLTTPVTARQGTDNERHDIKTDENDAVFVTNISHESVSTPEDFVALMKRGTSNRSTGATNMNERSSRSHLIMGINVTCRNLVNGKVKRSKLSLVDLAGSERVGKSGAEGDRLKVLLR